MVKLKPELATAALKKNAANHRIACNILSAARILLFFVGVYVLLEGELSPFFYLVSAIEFLLMWAFVRQ